MNQNNNGVGNDKDFMIIINAEQHTVNDKKVSYMDILGLVDKQIDDRQMHTVTYERGAHGQVTGTLSLGQDVVVKDGMVFNVETTNKS